MHTNFTVGCADFFRITHHSGVEVECDNIFISYMDVHLRKPQPGFVQNFSQFPDGHRTSDVNAKLRGRVTIREQIRTRASIETRG